MNDERRVSIRERFTRIEFVVVIFVVVVTLLIFFTAIPRALALRERQSCQANLKTIGEAMRMYSAESKGEFYPRAKMKDCAGNVQPWSGALDFAGFHPEYLKDLDLLVCPSYPAGKSAVEIWDQGKTTNPRWKATEGFSNNGTVEPCEVLAKPYYYYGWALSEATFDSAREWKSLESEDELPLDTHVSGVPILLEFRPEVHFCRFKLALHSLTEMIERGESEGTEPSWEWRYSNGKAIELTMGSQVWHLRDGVERYVMKGINAPSVSFQSRVVVLHEELFTSADDFYHGGGRTNVLYMDGHVACHKWFPRQAQKFPLNEAGFILHDAVEGTLTYEPQR
jgi:prepilin-type processing-associated H-X9-DG protein